jgi:hypothetical protein
MKTRKKSLRKKLRLRLRTRHMPTRVHENEDKRRYTRKKKHKKLIED